MKLYPPPDGIHLERGEYLPALAWRFAGAEYVDAALVRMNDRLGIVAEPEREAA